MEKLNGIKVNSVVSYIGGTVGYLGHFSYNSHADFYPSICGLDIDTNDYVGTTRQRFIKILSEANLIDQAKILQGVLELYPLERFEERFQEGLMTQIELNNKEKFHSKIKQWIEQLKGEFIESIELKNPVEFVKEVLEQADTLIKNHSYSSAVDRAHTALHGYLKSLCDKQNIKFNEQNIRIQEMWGKLKQEHPSFKIDLKEHQKPINQTVNAIGKFLENMNEIRNNHGFSHPNEDIIEENEAKFIINLSRVVLSYIDSKTHETYSIQ